MVNNAFLFEMRYSNLTETLRNAIEKCKLITFSVTETWLCLQVHCLFLLPRISSKTDRVTDFSVVCWILMSEVKKKKNFWFNGIIIAADGIGSQMSVLSFRNTVSIQSQHSNRKKAVLKQQKQQKSGLMCWRVTLPCFLLFRLDEWNSL